MTNPKIQTAYENGTRYYIRPGDGAKAVGVTSVLNVRPKPFLKSWGEKLVAETAIEDLPTILGMALKGDQQAAIDHLTNAPQRKTKAAADAGTAAHALFEKMARGGGVGAVPADVRPWVPVIDDFLNKVQPEFLFLEETIWNDTHGYAGSFDWIANVDGFRILGDTKTNASGVYPEVALQLAAYREAEWLIGQDGSQQAMPVVDGTAVLHIRPEGWNLYQIASEMGDRKNYFQHFLSLLQTFRFEREWEATTSKRALDSIAYSSQQGAAA